MAKIYIVDDDIQIAELLSAAIDSVGIDNQYFTSARQFIGTPLYDADVILLDLNMPDIDGIEVIRELGKGACQAQLVLISGHDKGVLHSAEQLAHAYSLKVAASLTKPIAMDQLKCLIQDISKVESVVTNVAAGEQSVISVDELRTAIHSNQLELHYQPQIHVRTGELHGVEGLVRWNHPERGLIFPDMFISLAENNHLISDLTSAVIRMSIKQSREWQNAGLNTKISVNISAENITSLSLPEQLIDLLSNNQLNPNILTLEVTESVLMGELVTSLDILTRLRMKGIGLSIDDFGTGYSSLSQLHRMPFTELKIDKSFVMSMVQDDESRAIVKTCIMLGHELHMEVVAEGVESDQIYAQLRAYGCDIAQGYFISRPMPAADVLPWLKEFDESLLLD